MFEKYLTLWKLIADGQPIYTATSQLLPVRRMDEPNKLAMLKVTAIEEERRGGQLLRWWNGKGAAAVFQHDEGAFLLERANSTTDFTDLIKIVKNGQDSEASRIICQVAAQLHSHQNINMPKLVSLNHWFVSLEKAAQHGGIFKDAWSVAQSLLSSPQDITVLHGDLHHGNILNFGSRGWLAIDPKGLLGERAFDFANILTNPTAEVALNVERFSKQVRVIAKAAQLEEERFLQWILAWCGLSAAWFLEDGMDATLPLTIAEFAAAECRKRGII